MIRHVTANKWDKLTARLADISRHVHDAEAALSYKPGKNDNQGLEADVLVLLATVRKAFAGSLDALVDGHGAVDRKTRGGRGGGRGRGTRARGVGRDVTFKSRLDTIEHMLWEAKYSSGFSNKAALAWRSELLEYLHQGKRRLEYTALFGHLANEWAEFRFGELSSASKGATEKKSSDLSQGEKDAVAVGRKEMYEQRQVWESHVTNERRTDTNKITEFLDELFHSGPRYEDRSADEPTDMRAILLRNIRDSISTSCKEKIEVTVDTVKAAIRGVLSSDQLTSDKRRAMLDISNKSNVLSEIVDILNIDTHLDSIQRWSWGENPITVQMRKAINGKYRVYLDLELLDAILIQCVGQFVSVNIREALDLAWKSDVRDVWAERPDEARTAAMQAQIVNLKDRNRTLLVNFWRQEMYERMFYAVRLPAYWGDVDKSYDDGDSTLTDETESKLTDLFSNQPKKASLKTDILRVCSAEMAVQKLVHGQFGVLQSDFEWFGPSLPHSALIAIMKYFHFPSELVHFSETFISMRMQFEEDGKDGAILTRKNGIPISFQITDGISELLLFVLDFAVNQKTGGAHLYRNHDDLWFWGQPDKCSVAWETIGNFTDVMGLHLNKKKTAFAHAVDESNPRYRAANNRDLARLPSGEVKWGFLLFNPSEWSWKANKDAIKEHMNELRFQLNSRTAVLAHIQAYNAYIENFLPNNFCPVITGLGDSHAIMVLEALQYAQQCLYGSNDTPEKANSTESSNVAQHVRKMIQDRFGAENQYEVPDCFLYMDPEKGGLGLANPVPSFAQYIDIAKKGEGQDDHKLAPMAQALHVLKQSLSEMYRSDAKAFTEKQHAKMQRSKRRRQLSVNKLFDDTELDTDVEMDVGGEGEGTKAVAVSQFMSFSDYVAGGEVHSHGMFEMYKAMLDPPVTELKHTRPSPKYWASSVFHSELEELFGGSISEDEFLSLGLYRTLAEEKVRWEG